jgi:branched-chain amino acid transport system substrate-binding protein
MQKSRVKRVGALLVGLTLVAAACGSDDSGDSSSDTDAATEASEVADSVEGKHSMAQITLLNRSHLLMFGRR